MIKNLLFSSMTFQHGFLIKNLNTYKKIKIKLPRFYFFKLQNYNIYSIKFLHKINMRIVHDRSFCKLQKKVHKQPRIIYHPHHFSQKIWKLNDDKYIVFE